MVADALPPSPIVCGWVRGRRCRRGLPGEVGEGVGVEAGAEEAAAAQDGVIEGRAAQVWRPSGRRRSGQRR